MSDIILSVENVSKLYRLGTVGTGTFGGDVQRFWKTKILGQEDPFLKVGQTNDRTSKEKAEFVWALQDINFEVKRGEVLGIIGKNGAGKSTLLKLLSRITSPTTGSIKSAGRMASLLEVGTGFHPELTGRENIFLNGAILGMTKKEIQSKFDEIVDFSGCEMYIDTPTKRYSSGMTVRLGFAVAAFLDPEILVVDEVLAVGDAEFQKKAIGKMKEVSAGGGRTVLFVSHNMASINALCTSTIYMQNGTINTIGETSIVLKKYLSGNNINSNIKVVDHKNDFFELRKVEVSNGDDKQREIFRDREIIFTFNFFCKSKFGHTYFLLKFKNEFGDYFLNTRSIKDGFKIEPGDEQVSMIVPSEFFNDGIYLVELSVHNFSETKGYSVYFHDSDFLQIEILPEKRQIGTWMGKEVGQIRHNFDWVKTR
jgi:lipopolysaccharide transport system ATP-binding protein